MDRPLSTDPWFADGTPLDRLGRLYRGDGPPHLVEQVRADPTHLARAYEATLPRADRRATGAFYTPPQIVGRLLDTTLLDPSLDRVLDPSCGAGLVLAEAARRTGDAARVHGRDIDDDAVQVARWVVGLVLGVDADALVDTIRVGDGLLDDLPIVDVVVGNPPFLGQLRGAGVETRDRRAAVRARWGDLVSAYTDPAWLFLAAGLSALAPGGRLALVQPQSVLAASHAAAIRGWVDQRAAATDVWHDDGGAFAGAAVATCVVTFREGSARGPRTPTWAALLPRADVPVPELATPRRLGDLCRATADFRDQYYGLLPHLRDGGDTPVVTTGLIDPLRCRWGERPARLGGHSWPAPSVDTRASHDDVDFSAWLARRRVPKVLVATQASIIEAWVDATGEAVGSVPAITVEGDDLWRIAAALSAPVLSAWVRTHLRGTGLSAGSVRLSAKALLDLPAPADDAGWDAAAARAHHLSARGGDLDDWAAFGAAADAAYGVHDPRLLDWWLGRLPTAAPHTI